MAVGRDPVEPHMLCRLLMQLCSALCSKYRVRLSGEPHLDSLCGSLPAEAVPKRILDIMQVTGLTRENVASHLQVGPSAMPSPFHSRIRCRLGNKNLRTRTWMVGFSTALSDLHAVFASESPTCRSDAYYAGSLLSPPKSICTVSLHGFLTGASFAPGPIRLHVAACRWCRWL